MTVFPKHLSSARSGDIASQVSLCQVGTGDGNGGCIVSIRVSGQGEVQEVDGRALHKCPRRDIPTHQMTACLHMAFVELSRDWTMCCHQQRASWIR